MENFSIVFKRDAVYETIDGQNKYDWYMKRFV